MIFKTVPVVSTNSPRMRAPLPPTKLVAPPAPPCAPHASMVNVPPVATVKVWMVPVAPTPVGLKVVTGMQAEAMHDRPAAHTLPQLPQLDLSLVTSTHVPPHDVSPVEH